MTEVTDLAAFLIIVGTVTVVLIWFYFIMRLFAFCSGEDW